MTAVARLSPGPVERALLGAGLWTLTGHVPPVLRVDPDELAAPGVAAALYPRAFRSKMLPMVTRYLAAIGVPVPCEETDVVEVYARKMAALFSDLDPIVDALTANGVETLILKGSDLAISAYPPGLVRMMADIDLLVKPPYLPVAAAVFREAGFIHGRVDIAALKITPLTEAEANEIKDSHYEIAPFVRIRTLPGAEVHRAVIRERLGNAFFTVAGDEVFFGQGYDVHFNVSENIEIGDLWEQTRTIALPSGRPVDAQSPTALLWFLAARAYHETMLESVPSIRPFIDVLAALRLHAGAIDWDWLLHIAQKYELQPSLFYLFWHANDLLGPMVPERVVEACRPDQPGVSRYHDWGDPMPKLLSTVAVASALRTSARVAANPPQIEVVPHIPAAHG